jgi:hypothetical protein
MMSTGSISAGVDRRTPGSFVGDRKFLVQIRARQRHEYADPVQEWVLWKAISSHVAPFSAVDLQISHSNQVRRGNQPRNRPQREADISPTGCTAAKQSSAALRVVLDAAVKGICEPDLPRLRQDHQVVPLGGRKIDRADQGKAVEDERQASADDSIRLVNKT